MAIWQAEMSRRDSLRALDREAEMISNSKGLLETHFTKGSDVVPFLDNLEKLAPQAGASAQVDSVDATPDGTSLMVNLKISGSFEAIYKFLTLLENSPYELNFSLVDIHKLVTPESLPNNLKNSKWEAVFKMQLLSFVQ
jgi:hypothetical protein